MYYRLQSHVNSDSEGKLCLSINNNDPLGYLVVNSINESDEGQLWQPIVLVNSANNAQVTVLLCKRLVNGQQVVVGFGAQSDAAPVYLDGAELGKVGWNLALPALQYAGNTSWNLNVSGNGPYRSGNKVIIWDWSGGQPNETWTLVSVDFMS